MVFSLVAACDDARIRVWDIPEGGLTETLTEPEFFLIGKFHLSHMRKEAQLITYTHSHTHTLPRSPGEAKHFGIPPPGQFPDGLSRVRWEGTGMEPRHTKSRDQLGTTQ